MTPEERKEAREMVGDWNSGESVPIGRPLDLLEIALDQMDADEGLMRQAAGYLGSMASGEPLRYSPVCDCDGCEGLRKLRPALRARLGAVPAQGEEASDESI